MPVSRARIYSCGKLKRTKRCAKFAAGHPRGERGFDCLILNFDDCKSSNAPVKTEILRSLTSRFSCCSDGARLGGSLSKVRWNAAAQASCCQEMPRNHE